MNVNWWAAAAAVAPFAAANAVFVWWLIRPPAGVEPNPPKRPPLPGPTPAQAASDASPPPGPGTTARVLRFRADLECGCQITHLLPRAAANSMQTRACPEHGWCGLCGWRIGALNGGRYAYVWETCPAHTEPAVTP